MAEEKSFTVHDRRRVKIDTESAETNRDAGIGDGGRKARQASGSVEGSRHLPPVDFTGFLLGLSQMALIHLGELPDPGTGKPSVDLEQARHSIDILDMLEQKTLGNLTEEEATLLRTLEGELKLKYVKASSQRGSAP